MKTVEQMTKEIDDMLVSLDSIHLEPTILENYEQTENQDGSCCEQQQLSCIQES
jgi:hypothetical protein